MIHRVRIRNNRFIPNDEAGGMVFSQADHEGVAKICIILNEVQ
jgi:hypothetical protein